MKLSPRTFAILWDVHAWSGALTSVVLFQLFFFGSFALFRVEVDGWSTASTLAPVDEWPTLDPMLRRLADDGALLGADRVAFSLERSELRAYWDQDGKSRELRYDVEGARWVPGVEQLGTFLYSMHYLGPIPGGIYVAGAASVVLLLVVFTGLAIHWKDLVRRWIAIRHQRSRRVWAGDLHRVVGMVTVPYQLLFAFTGAMFCLAGEVVSPPLDAVALRGDRATAAEARGDALDRAAPPRHPKALLPDLDRLRTAAKAQVASFRPTWIAIARPLDDSAEVTMIGEDGGATFGATRLRVRASDGAVLGVGRPGANAVQILDDWMSGLHYADVGGNPVKALYAWLALATCGVILTGNIVWVERRDRARGHAGHRLLEQLTLGACGGAVVATAVALFSCCVLASTAAKGPSVEKAVFFSTWAAATLAALLPGRWTRPRTAVRIAFLTASVFFAASAAWTFASRRDLVAREVGAAWALLAMIGVASAVACRPRLARPPSPASLDVARPS